MRASAHSRVERKAEVEPPQIAIRRRGQALLGGLLLIIAAVWVGVPVRGLLVGVPEVVPGLGAAGAGIALLIGAALGVIGLSWMLRRGTVAIAGDLVTTTDRRLIGTRTWREPLTGYRGVRLRGESRPHRYGARHCYVIELWHPKPARAIELDRIREPRLAERQAEVWAHRLRLPLCRGPAEAPPSGEVEVRDEGATEAAAVQGAVGAMMQPASAGSAVATRVGGRVPGAQPG